MEEGAPSALSAHSLSAEKKARSTQANHTHQRFVLEACSNVGLACPASWQLSLPSTAACWMPLLPKSRP